MASYKSVQCESVKIHNVRYTTAAQCGLSLISNSNSSCGAKKSKWIVQRALDWKERMENNSDWKFSSIFQIASLFTLINCIIKLYFTHRSILSFFRHSVEFSLWTFIDFQLFPNRNQIIKSKIQLEIQHRVKLNTKRIWFWAFEECTSTHLIWVDVRRSVMMRTECTMQIDRFIALQMIFSFKFIFFIKSHANNVEPIIINMTWLLWSSSCFHAFKH